MTKTMNTRLVLTDCSDDGLYDTTKKAWEFDGVEFQADPLLFRRLGHQHGSLIGRRYSMYIPSSEKCA